MSMPRHHSAVQITVRSSPITNTHSDQLSVCRHCHKHCKSKQLQLSSMSTSLKVQHSQASTPNRRCCLSPTSSSGGDGADGNRDKSNASRQRSSSSSSSASQTSQLSSQPSTLTGSCTMNAQLISESASAGNESRSQKQQQQQVEQQSQRPDDLSCRHRCHPDGHEKLDHESDGCEDSSEPASMTSSSDSAALLATTSTKNTEEHHKRNAHHQHHHHHHHHHQQQQHHLPCSCRCEPNDFQTQPRQTHELRKETCKLVDNVCDLYRSQSTTVGIPASVGSTVTNTHKNCKCNCSRSGQATTPATTIARPLAKSTAAASLDDETDDDWSLMLIGLAQLHPASALVQMDPFNSLPSIAVVPPTPDGLFTQFCGSPNWGAEAGPAPSIADATSTVRTEPDASGGSAAGVAVEEVTNNEASPEDSPQDEEPPYRSLNTSLKRYGTMSSLERFSSEDVDEKTYNSSEDDVNEADSESECINNCILRF